MALRRYNRYGPLVQVGKGLAGAGSLYGSYKAYDKFKKDLQEEYDYEMNKRRKNRKKYKKNKPKATTKTVQDVKQLKSKVRELNCKMETDQGTHIERMRDVWRVIASENQMAQVEKIFNTPATMESILSQLKYYNPSTPGTLTTADGATGAYSKEFLFEVIHSKLTIVNNYQVPCRLSVYLCKAKTDTGISPLTAFTNGLTDVGAPSSSSQLVYLTDSPQFNELWHIESSEKCYLDAGDKSVHSKSLKCMVLDPSVLDSQTDTYQKKYNSYVWVVRVDGVLGHDNASDLQGTLTAGVDCLMDRKYEVKYQAGAAIKTIVLADSSDTFTATAVVAQKPIPDVVPYSNA